MHWLIDYWNLEKEIVEFEKELIRLKEESAEPSAIQWLDDFLQAKKNDKLELVKLAGTFKGLNNQILKLKYVDGVLLESVAHKLGYSASYIFQTHAKLMKELKQKKAEDAL